MLNLSYNSAIYINDNDIPTILVYFQEHNEDDVTINTHGNYNIECGKKPYLYHIVKDPPLNYVPTFTIKK